MSDHATLFTAHPDAVVGLPALVSRAWDLSGLVERYEAFVADFAPLCRRRALALAVRSRRIPDPHALVHQFRGFPMIDPELPDELAPVAGPRSRAARVFHELYASLADASQRHFDAVTDAYVAAG